MKELYNRPLPVYSLLFAGFMKVIMVSLLVVGTGVGGRGQVTGDFQTKNASGYWSDYLSWNIRNGSSWIPASAGEIPGPASGIFVQAGHTINVDITTAACNDLNFTAPGITLKVILLPNAILTIYGSLVQFNNTNIPFPGFGAGAKIIFAGLGDQTILNSGINTNLNNVEINKTGGTFTLPGANTTFDVFTLTTGTVICVPAAVLTGSPASTVNIHGGNWTQVAGANRINGGTGVNIPLYINGGTMSLATTSGPGFDFSDVIITNGGILNLNNFPGNINITGSFSIDASSTLNNALTTIAAPALMVFQGTVNYTHSAFQSILNTSYGNLGLSGSGSKTPLADLNITGNITISGTAVLPPDNLTVRVGGNWTNYGTTGLTEGVSTVEFNGSGTQFINTTGGEDFFILKKSGTGTLTLQSDVRLSGPSSELNISNGELDAGTNTISGTGSTALTMTGGTLKLAKPGTTLPEFTIPSGYNLAGGTIELSGTSDQTLRGSRDYRNLSFSNNGTKTVTSAPSSITGTITVAGNAILDVGNNSMGGTGTNLTMTGTSRYRTEGTGTKPDARGVYTLGAGTTIEFANNAATQQNIRLGADYYNIDVSGTCVGNASASPGTPITLKAGGAFTVKSGGIFYLSNVSGFTGGTSTAINIVSTPAINLEINSTIGYNGLLDQVITNNLPYQNLLITGAGIKTAPLSDILTVRGNLSKSGTSIFEANDGTVLLNGNAQAFAGLTYNNLLLDNAGTKTMSGNVTILDSISIGNLGSNPATILDLGNNDVTLKSTASKTARAGTIAPDAFINYTGSGRFIIERFFPALRAWRLVTSPLSSDDTPTTIFSQWQNNGVYTPGKGTFVTGPDPFTATNGLDDSNFDNYSLKTYQDNDYVNIGNTLVPLSNNTPGAANIGYFMFVRGDRSRSPDNTVFPNTNATTLTSRGKLQTGMQTFICLPRILDGPRLFTLIGNPYASPVDFKNVERVNLVNRFIVWDPRLNVAGGFVTADDYLNTGIYTNTPFSPGGQDNNIQSGQAFFVETDTIGSSGISFNEGNKSGANNTGMFRPLNPSTTTASFRSSLYLANEDGSVLLADGNLAQFEDNFNKGVDMQDAMKFTNVNETFGLIRNNSLIAIERRPTITDRDTLFFKLTRITLGNYQLSFEPSNLDPLLTATLEDNYTGIKTPLSVASPGIFNFTVNDNVASADANRFQIIFSLTRPGTLPVRFGIARARQQGINIAVEWTVENEVIPGKYEVEKSTDGANFIKKNTTPAAGANRGSTTYHWLDLQPVNGDNYYRIRRIDPAGMIAFSRIVKINTAKTLTGISIYPNPVKGGITGLEFKNMEAGIYTANLVNNHGQVVSRTQINHPGGTSLETIATRNKLMPGIYQLEVTAPGKRNCTIRVTVE